MVADAFPLLAFHKMSQHVLGSLLGLSFSTERLSDVPALHFLELGCGAVTAAAITLWAKTTEICFSVWPGRLLFASQCECGR